MFKPQRNINLKKYKNIAQTKVCYNRTYTKNEACIKLKMVKTQFWDSRPHVLKLSPNTFTPANTFWNENKRFSLLSTLYQNESNKSLPWSMPWLSQTKQMIFNLDHKFGNEAQAPTLRPRKLHSGSMAMLSETVSIIYWIHVLLQTLLFDRLMRFSIECRGGRLHIDMLELGHH